MSKVKIPTLQTSQLQGFLKSRGLRLRYYRFILGSRNFSEMSMSGFWKSELFTSVLFADFSQYLLKSSICISVSTFVVYKGIFLIEGYKYQHTKRSNSICVRGKLKKMQNILILISVSLMVKANRNSRLCHS